MSMCPLYLYWLHYSCGSACKYCIMYIRAAESCSKVSGLICAHRGWSAWLKTWRLVQNPSGTNKSDVTTTVQNWAQKILAPCSGTYVCNMLSSIVWNIQLVLWSNGWSYTIFNLKYVSVSGWLKAVVYNEYFHECAFLVVVHGCFDTSHPQVVYMVYDVPDDGVCSLCVCAVVRKSLTNWSWWAR